MAVSITTTDQARDLLIIRGVDVVMTQGRKRWQVDGQEVSRDELIQLARQLDGDDERPSKYRNRKAEHDGHTFASIAECMRYQELRLLEQAGEIRDLELQPRFELLPGFVDWSGQRHQPVFYVADFLYRRNGRLVCGDVKGMRTDVYAIKVKFFLAQYRHIEFHEVRA